MNSTTLLVLLCETRQAIDAKGMSHFHWTLDKSDARKDQLASAIEDASSTVSYTHLTLPTILLV